MSPLLLAIENVLTAQSVRDLLAMCLAHLVSLEVPERWILNRVELLKGDEEVRKLQILNHFFLVTYFIVSLHFVFGMLLDFLDFVEFLA